MRRERSIAVAVVAVTAATVAVWLTQDGSEDAATSDRPVSTRAQAALTPGARGAAVRKAATAPRGPVGPWERRADAAQAALVREYANARSGGGGWPGLFRLRAPAKLRDRLGLRYWWQAQALDALVDVQKRAPTPENLARIHALVRGVRAANRGRLTNDYYDDMGWMALALLRADAVGARTAPAARRLWNVIRASWNDAYGGGVPWRRQQPAYKNVPANGPAAILAARLYRRDGRAEDLEWAQRIVAWMHATLVDTSTHVVWDGVNRQGDGRVDRRWLFTYTHGVVLGADLELHAITGDPALLSRARRTARAALDRLAPDGILRDEGPPATGRSSRASWRATSPGSTTRALAPCCGPAARPPGRHAIAPGASGRAGALRPGTARSSAPTSAGRCSSSASPRSNATDDSAARRARKRIGRRRKRALEPPHPPSRDVIDPRRRAVRAV